MSEKQNAFIALKIIMTCEQEFKKKFKNLKKSVRPIFD